MTSTSISCNSGYVLCQTRCVITINNYIRCATQAEVDSTKRIIAIVIGVIVAFFVLLFGGIFLYVRRTRALKKQQMELQLQQQMNFAAMNPTVAGPLLQQMPVYVNPPAYVPPQKF